MNILTHANSLQPPKKPLTPEPSLLAQGTYGCVYYPGFTCMGNIQTTKYITKLQKTDETIENELKIATQLKKIKNYRYYFAPIMKHCPVSLSNLQKKYSTQINKCNAIRDSKTRTLVQNPTQPKESIQFNVNRIRYILGNDLEETFKKISLHSDTSTTLTFLLDTYEYLTKSIEKMKKRNILHYDLKSNNIMYDEESNIPIIIDFGLSIQLNQIIPTAPDPEQIRYKFFDTYEYDYWCLEPIFIGIYADYYHQIIHPPIESIPPSPPSLPSTPQAQAQAIPPILTKEKYNQQTLEETLKERYKQTIQKYIQYAYFFKPEFQNKLTTLFPTSATQKNAKSQNIQNILQTFNKTFHTKWQNYIEEHTSDTLLTFFQTLWKSRLTWDHYSIAVIYLNLIIYLKPFPVNDPQLPVLEEFTQTLLNTLLALPHERM